MNSGFLEFSETWNMNFKKMNWGFLEILKTWNEIFLKNESRIFGIFGNLEHEFLK